jgi:hypothetical protein
MESCKQTSAISFGANAGAPEGLADPAPLVTTVVTNICRFELHYGRYTVLWYLQTLFTGLQMILVNVIPQLFILKQQ